MKKILLIGLMLFCFCKVAEARTVVTIIQPPSKRQAIEVAANIDYSQDLSAAGVWLMDQLGSSDNEPDETDNGRTMVDINAPISAAGKFGTSRQFNGSDEHFQDSFSPGIGGTQPCTFMAWVYLSDTTSETIISCSTEIVLRVNANKAEFILNAFDTNDRAVGLTNVGTGVWRHIAGTYGGPGEKIKIYLDGVEDSGGGVTPTGSYDFYTSWYLGNMNGGASYLDGRIDEPGMWNREFSLLEINNCKTYGILGDQ